MKAKKKEIDYDNIKPEDLTGEEAAFEVQLDSRAPVYCTDCRIKLEPTKVDVKRGNISIY